MNKISLEEYVYEPNGTRKDEWRQIILDAMQSGSYGRIKMLKECNYNPDEVIKRTYDGYLAECKVLNHLRKANPDQKWSFVSEDAGYFLIDCKTISDKPDLTNGEITIEVKRIKKKADNIYYIDKDYKNNDEFWAHVAHNANYLIIVDSISERKCIIISRQDLDNMKSYPNPWHPEKTTWEITGDIMEL